MQGYLCVHIDGIYFCVKQNQTLVTSDFKWISADSFLFHCCSTLTLFTSVPNASDFKCTQSISILPWIWYCQHCSFPSEKSSRGFGCCGRQTHCLLVAPWSPPACRTQLYTAVKSLWLFSCTVNSSILCKHHRMIKQLKIQLETEEWERTFCAFC